MKQEQILREARFSPKVINYWLLNGVIICIFTIVGIPLAVVWFFVGRVLCQKYLDRMSCRLTSKSLEIKKGWLVRVEKTIPLEKITDLAMIQGPIMRWMGLKGFKVETAGSGSGAGGSYLVNMIGIEDTDGFRDAVLAQRDLLAEQGPGARAAPARPAPGVEPEEQLRVLREIHKTLVMIETKLDDPGHG